MTEDRGNLSEEDFKLFNKIAETQARPIGGHGNSAIMSRDEVKNEIWVILLSIKDTYDESKGRKENYFRSCVGKRIVNIYNEVTKRPKKPKDEADDEGWFKWRKELQARNDLMTPREVPKEQENEEEEEWPDYADIELPSHLISFVEILKNGGQLSRDEINELKEFIAARAKRERNPESREQQATTCESI